MAITSSKGAHGEGKLRTSKFFASNEGSRAGAAAKKGARKSAVKKAKPKKWPWRLPSAKSEHNQASSKARAATNPTFASQMSNV